MLPMQSYLKVVSCLKLMNEEHLSCINHLIIYEETQLIRKYRFSINIDVD